MHPFRLTNVPVGVHVPQAGNPCTTLSEKDQNHSCLHGKECFSPSFNIFDVMLMQRFPVKYFVIKLVGKEANNMFDKNRLLHFTTSTFTMFLL